MSFNTTTNVDIYIIIILQKRRLFAKRNKKQTIDKKTVRNRVGG